MNGDAIYSFNHKWMYSKSTWQQIHILVMQHRLIIHTEIINFSLATNQAKQKFCYKGLRRLVYAHNFTGVLNGMFKKNNLKLFLKMFGEMLNANKLIILVVVIAYPHGKWIFFFYFFWLWYYHVNFIYYNGTKNGSSVFYCFEEKYYMNSTTFVTIPS